MASELGKILILLGGLMVLFGILLVAGGRLHIPLGRLPGDVVYRGKNTSFYFPIVTCLVLSVILSLLFWVLGRFGK
jgi:hypothetical protein